MNSLTQPFVLVLISILSTAINSAVAQQPYSCGDVCSPNSIGLDPEKLEQIDSTAKGWITNEQVAGCSAMIIRDGKVGYFQTWGNRDRQKELPVERDTIFRIYSMSKPITSVAAMQLIEQGKMDLDDPISKYLPAMKDMKVLVRKSRDRKKTKDASNGGEFEEIPARREITVRDLMSHTSGLTYGFFGDTPVDKKYRSAGVLLSDKDLSKTVEKLGEIPLLNQPGEKFHYSVSTDVLGRVVEVVSGQTLAEYFDEHLFEPLGMVDSFFTVPKDKRDRFAEMYTNDNSNLKESNPIESFRFNNPKNKLYSGGGGLCSTIDDYGRFAQMLVNLGELDGTRILKKETVEAMFTNQLDRTDNPPGQFKFGLGFSISDHGKNGTDYGWGGAAGTRFWANPDKKTAVLFMVQIKPTSGQFGETVRDIAYDAMND